MDVLFERWLNPQLRSDRKILAMGGLWAAAPNADPAAVVAEARQHGVRALELMMPETSAVADLPDLEHLSVMMLNDPEALYGMRKLRGLYISGTLGRPHRLPASAQPGVFYRGRVSAGRGRARDAV